MDTERIERLARDGDPQALDAWLRELYRRGGAGAVLRYTKTDGVDVDLAAVRFLHGLGHDVSWSSGQARLRFLPIVGDVGFLGCIACTHPSWHVFAWPSGLGDMLSATCARTAQTDALWACDCLEAKIDLSSPWDDARIDREALLVSCLDLIQRHNNTPREQAESWLFAARAFARNPGLRPEPHYVHRLLVGRAGDPMMYQHVGIQLMDMMVNNSPEDYKQGNFLASYVKAWAVRTLLDHRRNYILGLHNFMDRDWHLTVGLSPSKDVLSRIYSTFSQLMVPYLLGDKK